MALLSDAEIDARLAEAGSWRRGERATIVSEHELPNFQQALDYVNRVGALAEEANHHPDILVHGWNKVSLTLSTHSEGGLTAADFDLAKRIEGLS